MIGGGNIVPVNIAGNLAALLTLVNLRVHNVKLPGGRNLRVPLQVGRSERIFASTWKLGASLDDRSSVSVSIQPLKVAFAP
jgi:hypothetical protein